MFDLYIEFNDDSMVLPFKDEYSVNLVCSQLERSQGITCVYSDILKRHYYINTRNILYFCVEEQNSKNMDEDGNF